MAKRFIEQAGEALRDRNLVFAGKLAEKAAGIAAVLLGAATSEQGLPAIALPNSAVSPTPIAIAAQRSAQYLAI